MLVAWMYLETLLSSRVILSCFGCRVCEDRSFNFLIPQIHHSLMMKQFFFGSGLWKKCGMLKRHPLPCTLVGWKVSDTPGRYSPDVAHPKVSFVILFHHVSPV